jgi:hypothetical protein
MTKRKFKGNINPTYIVGTLENEAMISLYPNDASADCTDPTWQALIRLERNRPGSKLQQAKAKHKAWLEMLEVSRQVTD